jgi:hypothetical protein
MTLCVAYPQSSPAPSPLTEAEKRQIILQLYELQNARLQISTYETFIQREKDQDTKERENWQRSVELEKEAKALVQKELDLEKEKSTLYQNLYNTCKKKPGGVGCFFKRLFSFGLARC